MAFLAVWLESGLKREAILSLHFSVASISTGGSRKSFASRIRNLVEV